MGSCTGHRHTKVEVEQGRVHDSITTVNLKYDNEVNSTRVTITNTANTPTQFYLTPSTYDFGSTRGLVESITKGASTDEEKAIAIWQFVKDNTYHGLPVASAHLPHEPIRLLSSFGSGLCDDRNTALAILFNKGNGLEARVVELGGHMVAEVNYDNAWHMFDADLGVYYLDNKGKVASVQYISKHPEIVKTDFGKGALQGLLTTFTTPYIRSIYASQENNKVNTWQAKFPYRCEMGAIDPYRYSCSSILNAGDEVQLEVSHMNFFDKILRAVFSHSLSDYDRKGVLKRTIALNSKQEYVVEERSAYAVTQVRLRAADIENNTRVYYSPDIIHWFYKGTLTGHNEITFVPFSTEDEPCSFNYFVKYVPEDGKLSGTVKTESHFLFSPMLFTNFEKTFKIVAADSMARNDLSVKMEYTK